MADPGRVSPGGVVTGHGHGRPVVTNLIATVTVTVPTVGGTLVGTTDVVLTFVPTPPPPDPPAPPAPARATPGVRDTRPPAEIRAAFPGVRLTREFISGPLTTPKSLLAAVDKVCRPVWDAGLTPMYSLKLDPTQVVAGRWDGPLTELAGWHIAQPGAYLIPWHEPEDDMTGAQFAAHFNHIADQVRAVNDALPLVYAAMAYQWAPGRGGVGSIAGRTDAPAQWSAVDADVLAVDVYSGRSFPLVAILPEHAGFTRWLDKLVGGRQYMVTERGFEATTAQAELRAAQISREADWLTTHPTGQRCTGYVYWNTAGAESSTSLMLDAGHGVPALRDLVARLAA